MVISRLLKFALAADAVATAATGLLMAAFSGSLGSLLGSSTRASSSFRTQPSSAI